MNPTIERLSAGILACLRRVMGIVKPQIARLSVCKLGNLLKKGLHVATFVVLLGIIRITKQFTRETVMILRVKKRGNSLSVIIPKEMAISMNVDEGDSLFATKTPSGYEISAYDPNFVKKIEAARQGMRKYRNALIELAK